MNSDWKRWPNGDIQSHPFAGFKALPAKDGTLVILKLIYDTELDQSSVQLLLPIDALSEFISHLQEVERKMRADYRADTQIAKPS